MRTLNSHYRYLTGIAALHGLALCGLAVSGCSAARCSLWPADPQPKTAQASEVTPDNGDREAPEVAAAFERLSNAQRVAYEPAAFVSEAENSEPPPVAEIDSSSTMPNGGWSPAEVISGPAWIPDAPIRR